MEGYRGRKIEGDVGGGIMGIGVLELMGEIKGD